MPFACSICDAEATHICVRCTKDACANHICEKCQRCSDCCECEVALEEPIHASPVVRNADAAETTEPQAEYEAEAGAASEAAPDADLDPPAGADSESVIP